jgi:hypothetical protein
MFTIKTKVIGQSSVVSDDLVQSIDQNIVNNGASQFQKFHANFHKFNAQFSTVRLGYHKFFARQVPKMLTGLHKMQRMASALTFLK